MFAASNMQYFPGFRNDFSIYIEQMKSTAYEQFSGCLVMANGRRVHLGYSTDEFNLQILEVHFRKVAIEHLNKPLDWPLSTNFLKRSEGVNVPSFLPPGQSYVD